jgi:hypothetical protein
LHAATCAALFFAGAAVLTGCGGGGGDDDTDPNPNPSANTTATVRGRVVESTTRANIAGAVIRFGDVTVTTGENGEFIIQVPGGGEARTLFVDLSDRYFSNGASGTDTCIGLSSEGIPIGKQQLESGDLVNIGDIAVYDQETGPPPPPCNL